jgi:hypothetical protein
LARSIARSSLLLISFLLFDVEVFGRASVAGIFSESYCKSPVESSSGKPSIRFDEMLPSALL